MNEILVKSSSLYAGLKWQTLTTEIDDLITTS